MPSQAVLRQRQVLKNLVYASAITKQTREETYQGESSQSSSRTAESSGAKSKIGSVSDAVFSVQEKTAQKQIFLIQEAYKEPSDDSIAAGSSSESREECVRSNESEPPSAERDTFVVLVESVKQTQKLVLRLGKKYDQAIEKIDGAITSKLENVLFTDSSFGETGGDSSAANSASESTDKDVHSSDSEAPSTEPISLLALIEAVEDMQKTMLRLDIKKGKQYKVRKCVIN